MVCFKLLLLSILVSTIFGTDAVSRNSFFKDRLSKKIETELAKEEDASEDNGLGIIGGHDSEKGKLKWQVSLKLARNNTEFHFCGGSVIDEEWVLTAAHCMESFFNKEEGAEEAALLVVAGEYDMETIEGDEQPRKIKRVIMHPDYNKDVEMANDIALIKVDKKFEYNEYVGYISLPSKDDRFDGDNCTVSGWGDTNIDVDEEDTPAILQEVTVEIIPDKECESACEVATADYDYDCSILETAMCAGTEGGGKDSCQGDSGGPLACEGLDGTYQAGVVSYGNECGLSGLYGVYTETSYYLDWIEKVMKENDDDDTGAANSSLISTFLVLFSCLSALLLK